MSSHTYVIAYSIEGPFLVEWQIGEKNATAPIHQFPEDQGGM